MTAVYSVFGLGLHANLPIPGLVHLSVTPQLDVCVWLDLTPPWLDEFQKGMERAWFISPYRDQHGEPVLIVWELAGGGYYRLLYSDGTEFVVDRTGTRIWATWPDTLTLEDMATYLLGPVLGFVLRLRGVTCLHASAVAIGDQAIAILGAAGAGKSTTAAAFAERGYPVLSDDVAALSDQEHTFFVQPGYPRLRLWPSSIDTRYGPMDALPRLTPTWDKRYLDLTRNGYRFQQEPLPLAAIYILDERRPDPAAPFIQSVPAREGLMTLVANTYVNHLLDKTMRAHEFELLGRVVANVPLRLVNPHADPAYLPRLCETVLDDFRALASHALASTDQKQRMHV